MKLSLLVFFSMLVTSVFAQSAYDFLTRLPNIPSDACSMKDAQRSEFNDNMGKVMDEMGSIIRQSVKR